jgi:4-amino-4-deoxy-L-arabinose transferase-like glycosyltransferase
MPKGRGGEPALGTNYLYPLLLALFTLATRLLFHGPVYFADGPAHVRVTLAKVYVIQPPGYWLFNRTAGLFGDPALAISAMNISFSIAGVVVFYYTALFFTGRGRAFIAALAYSCIFYLWFAGEVHSTYASQALFPVAGFCALLFYDRHHVRWHLGLAALLFALGGGLRPSDGIFMMPMVVYFAASRLPKRTAVLFVVAVLGMDLAWILPTIVAYLQAPGGVRGVIAYSQDIVTQKSIGSGLNLWLGNLTRFTLPFLVAFWAVLPAAILRAMRGWGDWRVRMLVVWIVPGSLFFTLSYISDAPYLDFLTAAVLLLAVDAPRMLGVTALWNAVVFLGFHPIPSHRLPVNAWNSIVGNCTRYGVEHHWHRNLSDLQGSRDILAH